MNRAIEMQILPNQNYAYFLPCPLRLPPSAFQHWSHSTIVLTTMSSHSVMDFLYDPSDDEGLEPDSAGALLNGEMDDLPRPADGGYVDILQEEHYTDPHDSTSFKRSLASQFQLLEKEFEADVNKNGSSTFLLATLLVK